MALQPDVGCQSYVFGWSTGHVGTTTLSSNASYASGPSRPLSSVLFVFEQEFRRSYDYGNRTSLADEEAHVQHTYLPGLERIRRNRNPAASMCVDLSQLDINMTGSELAKRKRALSLCWPWGSDPPAPVPALLQLQLCPSLAPLPL